MKSWKIKLSTLRQIIRESLEADASLMEAVKLEGEEAAIVKKFESFLKKNKLFVDNSTVLTQIELFINRMKKQLNDIKDKTPLEFAKGEFESMEQSVFSALVQVGKTVQKSENDEMATAFDMIGNDIVDLLDKYTNEVKTAMKSLSADELAQLSQQDNGPVKNDPKKKPAKLSQSNMNALIKFRDLLQSIDLADEADEFVQEFTKCFFAAIEGKRTKALFNTIMSELKDLPIPAKSKNEFASVVAQINAEYENAVAAHDETGNADAYAKTQQSQPETPAGHPTRAVAQSQTRAKSPPRPKVDTRVSAV